MLRDHNNTRVCENEACSEKASRIYKLYVNVNIYKCINTTPLTITAANWSPCPGPLDCDGAFLIKLSDTYTEVLCLSDDPIESDNHAS